MGARKPDPGEEMLTSSEVGAAFRVTPFTVTRWVKKGKLTSVLTPGGQHRFRASEVQALLERSGSS